MWTEAGMPAASAWRAWARPISRPSGVTAELRLMFWDLKGATRTPCCRKMRQSAVVMRLLPTWEPVPRTMMAGVGMVGFWADPLIAVRLR